MITHPTSLSATLDAAAQAFFYQETLSTALRHEISSLIISRQCQSGANAGFFLPYAAESGAKVMLFSGEHLSTKLARDHIPMLEAVRILKLLALETPAISQSIKLACQRMDKMCYRSFCDAGECRALTIAYMRYRALDGTANSSPPIHDLLINLAGHRDGKGRWGSFPFFYTLLMLAETNDPLAMQELRYATPWCENQLAKNWPSDPISKRRQDIIAKALARS